jgi:hypothetical protein
MTSEFTFPPRADPSSLSQTTNIAPAAIDGRPKLRASDSSTRTITTRPRPRHLLSKSQSILPTLSTLNVRNDTLPTYLKSPKMATSHGPNSSSGAQDLLRQAMTQR